MKTVLYHTPTDVHAALARLGLSEAVLLEAVMQGYLARSNCTPNHPPMHAPLVAWGEVVRALRDGLAPDGWVRDNGDNAPRTVHPGGRISIIVATGNEATGTPGAAPATKSPKGATTIDALAVNRLQLPLPGMGPESCDLKDEEEKPTTWILLVHWGQGEIRCELSLPLDLDDQGRVTIWRERILLRATPLDPDTVDVAPPTQPDIDVTVRRRRA
jgi:hypothetical protein